MNKRTHPARTVSSSTVRDRGVRPIVVTLYPSGVIGLRPKGLRTEEQLDAGTLWEMAVVRRVARDARRGRA